jgi:2,3-bisphosphoglycerate-dependent phosphoglycerate mutase
MTDIFFIRHADSDLTIEDEKTRPLTEKGRADSLKIPALFEGVPIHHFYSSPYDRSIDTIIPLVEERGSFIKYIENFRERKNGQWIDDFFNYAEKQWNDFDYKLGSGESLNDVQTRNIYEVKILLKTHKNQSIVIGTHGTALCTIINYFDYTKGYDYFKSMVDIMPYIVKMRFEENRLIFMHEMKL